MWLCVRVGNLLACDCQKPHRLQYPMEKNGTGLIADRGVNL